MTNTVLEKKGSIHPSAVIHPSAEIGEGVIIGPNVVIGGRGSTGLWSLWRLPRNVEAC